MKAEAAQTALRAAQRRPAYRPAGRGGVPAAPTPDAAPLRTRERARTGESKRERWKGGLCPSPARPRPRLRRRRGARAGPTRTADPLPAIRFAGAVIKKALPGHPSWGGGRGRGRGDDLAAAPWRRWRPPRRDVPTSVGVAARGLRSGIRRRRRRRRVGVVLAAAAAAAVQWKRRRLGRVSGGGSGGGKRRPGGGDAAAGGGEQD